MAVIFSDLHTEAGLKYLNEFLARKSYISGDHFTKDDVKVCAAVLEKPGASFPSASKWYDSVSSQLAASFPGKAVGVRISGKAAPVEAAAAKEKKTSFSDTGMKCFASLNIELWPTDTDGRCVASLNIEIELNTTEDHPQK